MKLKGMFFMELRRIWTNFWDDITILRVFFIAKWMKKNGENRELFFTSQDFNFQIFFSQLG